MNLKTGRGNDMPRYTSITFDFKESDKIVLSDNPNDEDDTLTFSGKSFYLNIFFENRAAVNNFKEGLNHLKFEGETDEPLN